MVTMSAVIPRSQTALVLTRANTNWTPDELQYLSDKYGKVTLKTIARNLQRTELAVYEATKKRLSHQRIYDNFYSARELAQILGVKCAKGIVLWKEKGFIKGRKSPYHQGINKVWAFSEKEIVKFLRRYPFFCKIKNMQEHLFRAVVKEEWAKDPWYTQEQTAPMLGLKTADAVNKYIRRGWIPAEKRPGGPWQGVWIIRRSTIDAFLADDPRPRHKSEASSQARLSRRKEVGLPICRGRLWEIVCPRCRMEIKVLSPPRMIGTRVKEIFLEIYVNGSCSHGSICRVGQPVDTGVKVA